MYAGIFTVVPWDRLKLSVSRRGIYTVFHLSRLFTVVLIFTVIVNMVKCKLDGLFRRRIAKRLKCEDLPTHYEGARPATKRVATLAPLGHSYPAAICSWLACGTTPQGSLFRASTRGAISGPLRTELFPVSIAGWLSPETCVSAQLEHVISIP